jgi:hypothetical protein
MKCYFAKCSFKPLCAAHKYFNSMLGSLKKAKINWQKVKLHHTSDSVSYACSEYDLVMFNLFFPNSMHNYITYY